MEQNMTKSELDRSLHYHILKILDSYFSTYPQYTNNGYTLTVLGNKGFGEYHMIVQYNSGAKTLRTGYIEKKDNSGKYYKIRDQIKE